MTINTQTQQHRMDRLALATAALWVELEKRLPLEEVKKLRRWYSLVLHHTEPQVEQVVRNAQDAGASQVWLVRRADRLEVLVNGDELHYLDPPYPLILVAVFPHDDRGFNDDDRPGIEVRV